MNIKLLILTFIPIFVAVDALGIIPVFIPLVQGLSRSEKLKIIRESVITALVISIAFIFIGKALFRLLGVSVSDFMVAGGALLFILAVTDILMPEKPVNVLSTKTLGIVPLGTPLIVGPAVLTTALVLRDVYGAGPTLVSITLNVLLAGLILTMSDVFIRLLGEGGSKAISKVFSLLLAAIAVMLMRRGITDIITAVK